MSRRLMVVVGATGLQGGSVARTFLADTTTWKVRAITRNPSSEAARNLESQGAEVVAANLEDVSSLIEAFRGAYAIFVVTDFWAPYFSPENVKKAVQAKMPVNEWVRDYETQLGKNAFDAAAQTPGLQRFIFSSLPNVTKWSGGKYTHACHYDSKARVEDYARTTHTALWQKTSIILVAFYLSNYLVLPLFKPQKISEGTFVIPGRLRDDAVMLYIAPEEDTGPFVRALVSSEPGKKLIAYRAALTQPEFFDIWGRLLGVTCTATWADESKYAEQLGPEVAEELLESQYFINEYGFEARDDPEVIHPKDLGIDVNLESLERWVKKQNWSKVLSEDK